MKYEIQVSRQALKSLNDKKVSTEVKNIIYKKIVKLEENPFPQGCKKLKGHQYYRIRQGDYRIVYEIKNDKLIIVIINIAHRKNIYRNSL